MLKANGRRGLRLSSAPMSAVSTTIACDCACLSRPTRSGSTVCHALALRRELRRDDAAFAQFLQKRENKPAFDGKWLAHRVVCSPAGSSPMCAVPPSSYGTRAGKALADLLIRPIQRLPDYLLNVKRLIKETPPQHADHALCTQVAAPLSSIFVRTNTCCPLAQPRSRPCAQLPTPASHAGAHGDQRSSGVIERRRQRGGRSSQSRSWRLGAHWPRSATPSEVRRVICWPLVGWGCCCMASLWREAPWAHTAPPPEPAAASAGATFC